MKNSGIIFTLLLVTCVKFSRNVSLTSYLPIGEYHINVLKVLTCDPMKNNKIQINWHLNKVSTTSSEFNGNITIDTIPFDDNLNLLITMDTRDSKGNWIPKTFVLKKEKACSTLASFVNPKYFNAVGWKGNCPRLPGLYNTQGFPATNMNKGLSNIPEVAPYGIYKLCLLITNKNDEHIGCFHMLVEIKHP